MVKEMVRLMVMVVNGGNNGDNGGFCICLSWGLRQDSNLGECH